MNVGTGTGTGIELPCKYYLYASKKYKHNMRNATIKKQCSYDRSSDGFLQMRFRGLIFGRACFFMEVGGGAYYRNYTVLTVWLRHIAMHAHPNSPEYSRV